MGRRSLAMISIACLMLVAWALMVAANTLPDWSSSSARRVGLWLDCRTNLTLTNGSQPNETLVVATEWACKPVTDGLDDSLLFAAEFFAVLGCVLAFIAACIALASAFFVRRYVIVAACVACACAMVTLFLAWGTWLGAERKLFPELSLSTSFILCAVAAGIAFFCTCATSARLFLFLVRADPATGLEFAPGMSGDEAAMVPANTPLGQDKSEATAFPHTRPLTPEASTAIPSLPSTSRRSPRCPPYNCQSPDTHPSKDASPAGLTPTNNGSRTPEPGFGGSPAPDVSVQLSTDEPPADEPSYEAPMV